MVTVVAGITLTTEDADKLKARTSTASIVTYDIESKKVFRISPSFPIYDDALYVAYRNNLNNRPTSHSEVIATDVAGNLHRLSPYTPLS